MATEVAERVAVDPQKVLDSLSAHIAILDQNGTIVQVNRAWNRCFAQRLQGLSFRTRRRSVRPRRIGGIVHAASPATQASQQPLANARTRPI